VDVVVVLVVIKQTQEGFQGQMERASWNNGRNAQREEYHGSIVFSTRRVRGVILYVLSV
jgi:hypothetical protein